MRPTLIFRVAKRLNSKSRCVIMQGKYRRQRTRSLQLSHPRALFEVCSQCLPLMRKILEVRIETLRLKQFSLIPIRVELPRFLIPNRMYQQLSQRSLTTRSTLLNNKLMNYRSMGRVKCLLRRFAYRSQRNK
jgi:hypothetical protein